MKSHVETFWRYHEKPSYRLPKPRSNHSPEPGTLAHVRQLMKQATDTAIASGLPRPLFPFEAADVEAIYTHKKDEGDGLWFGLIDGRIFNSSSDQDSSDPGLYEPVDPA